MELQFIDYQKFQPRLYQELISATASQKNTLCILPTGLGKTYIGVLVTAYRLEQYPDSKVLIIAPTRPLVNQHLQTFKSIMVLDDDKFIALTGKIHQQDRKVLYSKGRVFFATPEIIRNDVNSGTLNLRDVSLLIVDECHRSVKKYAYTSVSDVYFKESDHPLVLGLTASPGGMKDKIDEVKQNLKIEAVEIRTEKDPDVSPYVKETEVEKIYVELPEEFVKIKKLIEDSYVNKTNLLLYSKLINYAKPSKRDLLDVQSRLGAEYSKTRDHRVGHMLSVCAQAVKLAHAIELVETQGVTQVYKYFKELEKQMSSATKQILSDERVKRGLVGITDLYVKGVDHPKLIKLIEIVKNEIDRRKNVKIIVFANYRDTVDKIAKVLQEAGIEAREFIGQTKKSGKGLSQKEQMQLLKEFEYEMFNVLISTSIGEEGLSIPAVDLVMFYEPVASEIRTTQRRGRTGRTEAGRVIFLITKGTRDEGYYWSAYHKEKKMKKIVEDIKDKKSLNAYFK